MGTAVLEQSGKQLVADVVASMPDSATLEDIREELSILSLIRKGQEDSRAGNTMTHEEAMRRSAPWITP